MRCFVDLARRAGQCSVHLMCRERHVGLYADLRYRCPLSSRPDIVAWREVQIELPSID
jgi:hypothetical protein